MKSTAAHGACNVTRYATRYRAASRMVLFLKACRELAAYFIDIDAPEKRQAFGERSKQNLSRMAFQKDARLDCHKADQYGRKVCKVWVQPGDCPSCGKTLEVGHAQVIAGLAWWYRAYAKEQTPEDCGRYESAEQDVRLRKRGIWSMSEPVPPWEWRRQGKK